MKRRRRRSRWPWPPEETAFLKQEWGALGWRQLRTKLREIFLAARPDLDPQRIRLRSVDAIWQHARRVGLPTGMPQGFVGLAEASRRSGFDIDTIQRICKRRKVAIRLQPTARTRPGQQSRHRAVEWDVLRDAIERDMARETLPAAARRLGVSGDALRDWLRADGVLPAAGVTRSPIRLLPKVYDQAASKRMGESILQASLRLGVDNHALRAALPEVATRMRVATRLPPEVYDRAAKTIIAKRRPRRAKGPTLVRAAGTTCRDGRAEVPAAPTSTGTSPDLARRTA